MIYRSEQLINPNTFEPCRALAIRVLVSDDFFYAPVWITTPEELKLMFPKYVPDARLTNVISLKMFETSHHPHPSVKDLLVKEMRLIEDCTKEPWSIADLVCTWSADQSKHVTLNVTFRSLLDAARYRLLTELG